MSRITTVAELEQYHGTLLRQARECEEREESSGMLRVRSFWHLEAARLRNVARDADLLAQELESRGAA